MKNFCFSVLAALLVSGCTISGVSSKDKATTYYTQHSFYYEKGRYITTNYARGGVVSVNTMVKITNIGRNSMELELKDGTPLTVVNVKGFTLQDINGIRGRLLGEKPVILSGSGAGMQKAIKSGELKVGMRKSEVLLARGYPPAHVTPSLDSDKWIYWQSRYNRIELSFDNGRLTHIRE